MSSLKASHIACLEDATARLYAEVIQIVSERQCCWARPIALVQDSRAESFDAFDSYGHSWTDADISLHDLREGADLLLPLSLFRVALDTEVVPLLMRLEVNKSQPQSDRQVHQLLQEFVRQLCKTYPEAFQT